MHQKNAVTLTSKEPLVILTALLALFLLLSCAPAQPVDPPIPGIPGQKGDLPPAVPIKLTQEPGGLRVKGGGLEVVVTLDPFDFVVKRTEDGALLLETATGPRDSGFAPISFTNNIGFTWNTFYWGYRGYVGFDEPWAHGVRALHHHDGGDRVYFEVGADKSVRGKILFVVGPFYEGAVRLAASVTAGVGCVNRVVFTFASPEDEHYVGFGERFNSVDQRGRVVSHWAEEGSIELGFLRPLFAFLFDLFPFVPELTPEYALPGGETASYAPIPFFLSNRGYGFLADVPHPSHFDLAYPHEGMWRVASESSQLSAVVFSGPTPADVLCQYTERTGRSLVPRPWVFAPWNQMTNYSQGSPLDVARIFREKDIPSSVRAGSLHFLPAGDERGKEDQLVVDNTYLHDMGYKSLCYYNPRIDKEQYEDLWNEGAALGHFVRNAAGEPYILNVIAARLFVVSILDFTHAGASDWYGNLLQKAVDLGFDGWMYDFGEYTPPDASFSDGNNGHYWHNPYALIYQKAGYQFFRDLDDDPTDSLAPDYVFYHRSGYAGSQHWAWAMWGGDPAADWSVSDGLPAAVTGGINCGLSGIPFWGSDIGGFHALLIPPPTSELLKRWTEFGAFSGLMRDQTGGKIETGPRVQILDEEELTYIVRRYQKIRTQLVPYITNAAWEAHALGLPLMRAPLLHFPDDPRAWDLKREYLFGPDLYVAPVVEEGAAERTLYLPPGRWVELWDRTEYDGTLEGGGTGGFRIGGAPVEGGREITVDAPIDEIPVFVRMNTVIPLVDPRVDTFVPANPPNGLEVKTADDLKHLLHLWAFPEGRKTTTLADGSMVDVQSGADGVTLLRIAPEDDKEVIAQVIWPEGLTAPDRVLGLTFVGDADPLALDPGTWTWSAGRNALALHGEPGQMEFSITCSP